MWLRVEAMEKKQAHLTVFGWIMLAWFCLSVGLLVLGLVGWMSERMSVWFGSMDRDDMFGAIGLVGVLNIIAQMFALLALGPFGPKDEWFVSSD